MNFLTQYQEWDTKRKAFETNRGADQRRAICDRCEFVSSTGLFCQKCGCLLALKILVMESCCPDQPARW